MSKLHKYINEVYDDRDMPDSMRRNQKDESIGTNKQIEQLEKEIENLNIQIDDLVKAIKGALNGMGQGSSREDNHIAESILWQAIRGYE